MTHSTSFWGHLSPHVNSYEAWMPGVSYFVVEPWNVLTSCPMILLALGYGFSAQTSVVRGAYRALGFAGAMSVFQHTTMWHFALWMDYLGVATMGGYLLYHRMDRSLSQTVFWIALAAAGISAMDKFQLLPTKTFFGLPWHSLWHLGVTWAAHLLFQTHDQRLK